MKAAVLYEQRKPLVVDDIEVEDPKAGEVMVKIAAAGVCHSDLHYINGMWPCTLPMVVGHEGAGVVEKVGPGVYSLVPGDHVILSWVAPCGVCEACASGRPYLCPTSLQKTGSTLWDGTPRFRKGSQPIYHQLCVSSFSEYVIVPQTGAVKIRRDMPLDKAALIGCGVVTGVGAVFNAAKVIPGSSVAVFGCGGVGLNVIQGAALAHATKIMAVDPVDSKLELAKQFGATHLVKSSFGDPVAQIKFLTYHNDEDMGADYVFEVVGKTSVLTQAFESTRYGGTCILVGMPPAMSNVVLSTTGIFLNKVLTGAFYGSARVHYDMPMLVELYMAGKLKLDELISGTYPLEKINDALDALRKGEALRSIITF
jgi:NDMA-dependent alcohol dehydrogenase